MIANIAKSSAKKQPNANVRSGHLITSLSKFAIVIENTIDATVIMILALHPPSSSISFDCRD